MSIEIQDNSKEVSAAIKEALLRGLEKCGLAADGRPAKAHYHHEPRQRDPNSQNRRDRRAERRTHGQLRGGAKDGDSAQARVGGDAG